jgi:hypothetical protein
MDELETPPPSKQLGRSSMGIFTIRGMVLMRGSDRSRVPLAAMT